MVAAAVGGAGAPPAPPVDPPLSVGEFTGVPGPGSGDMQSPISASLGAMGSLLRKLDMLLLEPSEGLLRLHKGAKRATHLLRDDLEEITSYLEDLTEVEDPPLTAKCWMKEVRELSYDIENYIDSFVLPGHVANIKTRSGRRRRCGCRQIRLRHIKITRLLETNKKLNRRKRVAARISDFRIDAREALERHKRYELHCCASIKCGLLPATGRLPTRCEEGAGIIIDDRMREFMDSMADDRDPQLKVVSVVGSEGIGKTTLVRVLYHKLKGQFDCRAFIRLTRKPDIKTVLRDILTQVQQQQQPHNHCEDPDLLGKIREHLQYKRYLIVIDDLWSASIWDVISYAFPGGKMCSRIITSTQIEDVALACCYYHSEYVFKMRPLDEDLSRELFFNSFFCPENDFPQKLKDVLSKIVKICGGLPLATTVIASLLATHPVILMEQWTYIYDSLSSKLKTSSSASEGMKLVVNFSYNNLTSCLKTCLLYLSIYPEGYTVCKDDLVKQWVAEGFIDGTEGREVETAESYFHELIGRRFLQRECIKYTGEVVSCSVPAVVRDLIAQKSLEENFVVVLDHYRRNVSLSEKVHRLSLHFPHTKYAMTNIRSSQVRSLTCFGLSKCMPSIREFKLLRVLNLNLSGHDDDGEDIIDLTWISELLRLRYLKVASDVCVELPKHMGGLQYLETVVISKKVTDVPSDIIHLPRLLHLHLPFETNLMDWLDMTGPAASVWSFGKPTNLQYLYLTCFIPVPDHLQRNILSIIGSLFRGLGSLKTLAFIISSAHKNAVAHGPSEETVAWDWDDFAPPLLERFEWLLHSCSFSRVPKWIGKLGNLCILKISVRELMRDGVNILGELPALITLSLYVKIPPIERIIFDKAGFSVLKYFKFKCSTVPWLKFEVDAMPNLQKLKLGFSAHSHWVDQQSTVPISIEHLPSLKEISAKVADASSDAEPALTSAISNHPRNPRIRMQLVDWNSYGHGVWYTVSKRENPLALEEDNIPDPEEGLDDHRVPQYKDSRDDQNKEACIRHDVGKRRRKENTKNLESPDASTSPSVVEGSVQNNWGFEHFTASSSYASKVTYASPPPNITDKGKSYASSTPDILSTTFTISCISEATNPQQRDSKIERCQAEGCRKRARGPSGRCIGHGGGRRCQKDGCDKGAEGKTIFCKAHGGGKRCKHLGCTKSAEGRTDFCIAHGGGRRCSHEGCGRAARGKSGLCIKHGGGKRCQMVNCTKSAEGRSGLCISHGGRCQYPYCTKGAQGSTKFCKAHDGGKRCASLGCTEAAEGSTEFCKGHGGGKHCAFQGGGVCTKSMTQFCVAHGGGKRCAAEGFTKSVHGTQFCVAHGGGFKRCAAEGCTKSSSGLTGRCVDHRGGKRCQFEGCSNSAQGSTDFCKAHGGGKRSWQQLHPNFSTAGQQAIRAHQAASRALADLRMFRRKMRIDNSHSSSKTGLCSADSTSSIQNISASDGGTSLSAIGLFATAKPNELKIAEDKGDPPRTPAKSNDDKSGILPVLVQSRTPVPEGRVLAPLSEGRVHDASSLARTKEWRATR